jgi:hypothetical protein
MKKHLYIFFLLAMAVGFTSCEEVIDVDLNTAAPRLVIDAALKWEKETDGSVQVIKLSTTTGFFNQNIPTVSGATVFVTNDANEVFDFVETIPNSGAYICTNFSAVLNATYTLTVIQNGITYSATEALMPVPPIDKIEQKKDGGFLGNSIEVRYFYTDNGMTDDFYLTKFQFSSYTIPEFGVISDELFQGNQFSDTYSNEDIKQGDQLDIQFSGISEGYFNYLRVLFSIAGSTNGSPFQSPPATVRGNIVNMSDINNFALGFFSLSETDTIVYVIE